MLAYMRDILRRLTERPTGDVDEPFDAPEPAAMPDAVARALSMVGKGEYRLGTGDYRPSKGVDEPWTVRVGKRGSDCSGFAQAWCHRIPRHRPGYNRGGSVVDWINTDSGADDAYGVVSDRTGKIVRGATHEIYVPATHAEPGDLLVYRSIVKDGKRVLIGHVGIVVDVPDGWRPGDWKALAIVQCRGPNGKRPGVVKTDGQTWARHDAIWGSGEKPWRRSMLLRVRK